MKELSLNLLDIAQNSISAGAGNIEISVCESLENDRMILSITDDGRGMSQEFLSRVTDPFTTTRKTRKVGMGIPLFKLAAELTGGTFSIDSTLGKGTVVTAVFVPSHIDMPPLGDMTGTMLTLIQGSPQLNFVFRHKTDRGEFTLDTRQLRQILGDVPINEPDVLNWIRDFINENEL